MICVTIVQESRRLALADMLNAAMLGADLVEVRLDKFEKDANLTELVTARRKPVLFSCRRPKDGGEWSGTEDERLTLLRSAVIAKADYVEVELDAADQIRPFPGCKRVVSYTNLSETPKDIDAIYQQLQTKKPDVIKVTCKADTPEQAWPLVHLLNKPPVPTIVEARGPAGTMLTLVGRKVGAPWTTAAMERGMEAFPGQPTVQDLVDIYRYRQIGKPTRFVGVTGDGERSRVVCGLLNTAFAHANLPHQALPMEMGNKRLFKKVAEAIRLQSVFLDEAQYEGQHEIAKLDESAVSPVLAADGLTPGETEWTAFNALGPAVATALLDIKREREGGESLKGRVVALAGCGALTRMLAIPLKAAGASLMWASRDRNAVHAASQAFGGRQVLWEAVYATSHDVLVIGRDGSKTDAGSDLPLHPGYLKSGMIVVDLTAGMAPSKFLREAESRGCGIVSPGRILVEQVRDHVRRLGADVSATVLTEKLSGWFAED
ncbi:MAG TPA: type I 3-dehydroquinate dehydratase [Gemmataceae bacterium]|jgi:3-dehydroquinate dehydratase/shikimate dehydrogenase|nr:type I 3-dehydroquinate dehydratase [Gemmataceae bacterium]